MFDQALADLGTWLSPSKPGQLLPAYIFRHATDRASGKTISVQYRPNALKFGRTVGFKGGGDALQVDEVREHDLTVALFFDSCEEQSDVRDKTRDIYDLTLLTDGADQRKMPPMVEFHWGKHWFSGFVSHVTQSFDMFLPNGKPVRANMEVTFTQVQTDRQRALSKGLDNCRMHWMVKEGDRLHMIAQQAYGDWTLMWLIAQANAIYDVLGFPRASDLGRTLIIPDTHGETFEPKREMSYV
jgi:Contractile injection system tube protein